MIMRTTVGINRMLSIRDVFLISAIVDERYADRDFLMSSPKDPSCLVMRSVWNSCSAIHSVIP